MNLHVFTIVRNGLPWLPCIYVELGRAGIPFHWHVVEGASMNVGCTRWMKAQAPGLSDDGTTEFLDDLAHDPRVSVYRKSSWNGRLEMVNAPLANIAEECVLLQADSDEVFTGEQYRQIVYNFADDPALMAMRFRCRYYVAPGLIVTNDGDANDWLRAWRYRPGMRHVSHEPPNLAGNHGKCMSAGESAMLLGTFEHFSYATRKQVDMKEKLYGYAGALTGWDRLVRHKEFPVRLKSFLPWQKPQVLVDRVS